MPKCCSTAARIWAGVRLTLTPASRGSMGRGSGRGPGLTNLLLGGVAFGGTWLTYRSTRRRLGGSRKRRPRGGTGEAGAAAPAAGAAAPAAARHRQRAPGTSPCMSRVNVRVGPTPTCGQLAPLRQKKKSPPGRGAPPVLPRTVDPVRHRLHRPQPMSTPYDAAQETHGFLYDGGICCCCKRRDSKQVPTTTTILLHEIVVLRYAYPY